jgi:maleate cis-trans isomerase
MTRLGFIYPGGGAEYEYYLFAERHGFQAFLVGSRIPAGDDHAVEALLQTARVEHIVEAGRHLVPLQPDAVVWACTSGSFIVGRAGAEAQVEALAKATGRPATSTSLAFVAALARLRARRVAVLATYPEPASRAFGAFLAEHEITVASLDWLDAPSGFDAAAIESDRLLVAAEGTARDVEALLIPDTALPTLDLIVKLEQRIGRPVLTANQVTLWAALGLAGRPQRAVGYGRLFGLDNEESAR